MKIKDHLLSLALPLALLAWVIASRIPPSSLPSSQIEAPRENFLAPDFTLETTAGDTITLSELRGRPIILNFWASWCPPCRAEMPAFQLGWEEYQGTDLMILAVNATNQDSRSEITSFINQNQLEFPILLDRNGSVSSSYLIHSLPTTYLISREGVVQKTLIGGPIPLSLLRVLADDLLQDNTYAPDN